ncbi:hypothetical protein LX36DRAFT_288835 [Colletotrichum falcatum]|nr:hypothetical protein LX36DRAFT_288835 [Colletotrichum falcatum]
MSPLSRRDLATASIIRPGRSRVIVPAGATRAEEKSASRCQLCHNHIVATYSSCAISSPWRLTRQEFRSRTDQCHITPLLDLQYAATLYFSFINAPHSTQEDKNPSAWAGLSLPFTPTVSVSPGRPERTHMRSDNINKRCRNFPQQKATISGGMNENEINMRFGNGS